MAKKALILGERICQIVDAGEEFEVHKDFQWVDVADDTVDNADTYKDGKVVKALTLAQSRALEDPLHVCIEERMENYPSLSDFADAYYWEKKGDDSKMTAWVAACAKVKSDHPKPE
tara:strand:- start:362 stop:709 length:348 start_codon:yes stop_codon:yes gene_type:complete